MQEGQTFHANIELITSASCHQGSIWPSFVTKQDISGEYQLIESKPHREQFHIFCNERGHDLILDFEDMEAIEAGENLTVGRSKRLI